MSLLCPLESRTFTAHLDEGLSGRLALNHDG
jgi:hypothetical protein